jgi:hypothetical protein
MDIKTIPLTRLEASPRETLNECAETGQTLVVELPGRRLVVIQSLDLTDDDDLVNQLLESNAEFRALVARSKAGPRRPFGETAQT